MIKIYCVHDSAAERYLDPWTAPTHEVAMRGFRQAVNAEGHQFNQFPDDYTLFFVGEFNPETGTVISSHPVSMGNALEYVQKTELPTATQLPLELTEEETADA